MSAPSRQSRRAVADIVRALRYAAPFRGRLARKAGYGILTALPSLLLPWPGKILVDHIILKQPIDTGHYPAFLETPIRYLGTAQPLEVVLYLLGFTLLMLFVFGATSSEARDQAASLLAAGDDTATQQENAANHGHSYMGGLIGWLEWKLTIQLTQDINHHYRSKLFGQIQRLPMTDLDNRRIGDAIYRLMYDTPEITEVCYRILLTPISTPLIVGATLLILGTTYETTVVWLPAAVMIPIGFFSTLPFAGAVRRRSQASRESGATATATLEENIANVMAVQGLGGETAARGRFEEHSWASFSAWRSFAVVWIVLIAVIIFAGIPSFLWVFYALTDRVFTGELSVGDLGVILAYYGQIAFMTSEIGRLWIYMQDNVVGLRRVFELMDSPSDPQPEQPAPLPKVEHGFHFDAVGFTYPDGTRALDRISLSAERGQQVALVGPAGAGKSTLAYLFPRFISPSEGTITVDHHDLQSVDREDLRNQIAFVFQEANLFSASIADNIRVGRPHATDDEVREAARMARAADFIEKLPDGYATTIGRTGSKLSVGQRQRIAIARALVRRAPILILDEPTAALDPATEADLVATLDELRNDTLVVVIAHRLSTIRRADKIVYLDQGRIIEQGSHDELMQRGGGAYQRFVELQRGTTAA